MEELDPEFVEALVTSLASAGGNGGNLSAPYHAMALTTITFRKTNLQGPLASETSLGHFSLGMMAFRLQASAKTEAKNILKKRSTSLGRIFRQGPCIIRPQQESLIITGQPYAQEGTDEVWVWASALAPCLLNLHNLGRDSRGSRVAARRTPDDPSFSVEGKIPPQ